MQFKNKKQKHGIYNINLIVFLNVYKQRAELMLSLDALMKIRVCSYTILRARQRGNYCLGCISFVPRGCVYMRYLLQSRLISCEYISLHLHMHHF